MSDRGETELAMAVRYVAEAHRTVEQQRRRIATLKEAGKPNFKQEQMLRAFESTLRIFEEDERRIRERVEDHLAQAGRRVAEGERHIVGQQNVVTELERDGHDATIALSLLRRFEETLALHIADRDRLRAELAVMK